MPNAQTEWSIIYQPEFNKVITRSVETGPSVCSMCMYSRGLQSVAHKLPVAHELIQSSTSLLIKS